MANLYDSGICLSCQDDGFEYHYKCLLQQKYTDLEQKLDSENGLVSQMFQRRIISFNEKKSFEGMANNCKRNRKIIDLFFENRNYLSFLECLKASGQSHILDCLNCEEHICKSVESKVSVTNSDHCEEGEFQFVGKITLEDKLVVMGLCNMDGLIYAICHMDPHVFIFLAKPPFIPQPFREFDLPVQKDQFHFYDMVCSEEEGILVVSDKANRCLWLADVNKKQTSKFEVTNGSPLRMSVSGYVPICSDDEGYEDIYGGNCKDFEGSFDSSVESDAGKLLPAGSGCFDTEKLVERLLVEKISFVDKKIQNGKVSSGRIALKADKKNIILVVQHEGQYFLNFYSNTFKMKFLKRISLMIGKEFSTSNAVQRKCDGHIFICYGDVDYGNKDNSPWYLGEYSPDGEILRSYLSQPKVWIPRYITSDDVDTKVIYAIARFSGEIIKLKCIPDEQVLNISSLSTNKHQLIMPSRHRFCRERRDDGKERLILLVGQGEIKKPHPSASIVVLKRDL